MDRLNTDWRPRPAPEGWVVQGHKDTFSNLAGPFYFRTDPKTPGIGFFSEPVHCNVQGNVHGGALLTLADMSLFDIAFRSIGRFRAVTVSMTSDFVGAGPVDKFIEASGEVVRAGKSLIFCRGMVTAEGAPVMSYSGMLKRVGGG